MENFFIMYMYRRFFMRYLNKKGEWVGQEDQEEKSEELLDRLPHNIAGVVKNSFKHFIYTDSLQTGRTVLVLLLRYTVY